MAELTVVEVEALMAGMARHKIGLLEYGGLKLVLSTERPVSLSPVSSLNVPGGIMPARLTAADAEVAVAAARVQAEKNAASRIDEARARTARARVKAASGIASNSAKLVGDIFKASQLPTPSAHVADKP